MNRFREEIDHITQEHFQSKAEARDLKIQNEGLLRELRRMKKEKHAWYIEWYHLVLKPMFDRQSREVMRGEGDGI